ncbi:PTS sugar transporter subunit IIB [Tatumella citrea]|uniref:PTS EIIB type-2 domain-containing protein n=1 Tax=Tatumella citrea TaxID=53336 RepID=A0A1Y0LHP8_TATCI|nr:PTS sugar transporter subunit IIB [Tatumella citrea]ARU93594.1 hypothetical protein A7K98_07275 [Tatumella citrea]ARU97632.1 hypothetical protein A7K99_07275 [Tatumella citrea]
MKIYAVCGHGLGSSFMLEKNIKTVMTKIGKEAEVGHIDLASVTNNLADIFVVGQDLAPGISGKVDAHKVVVLKSIIAKAELEEKLSQWLADNA